MGLIRRSCLHFGRGTHKSAPTNVLKKRQQLIHNLQERERERERNGKLEQRDHIIYVHVCDSGLRIIRTERYTYVVVESAYLFRDRLIFKLGYD